MTAEQIWKKIKAGEDLKVIDIRDKVRYDTLHIPTATHAEPGAMLENPDKYVNKETMTYITCNSGNSSSMVTMVLQNQGYKVESVEGGMNPLVNLMSK